MNVKIFGVCFEPDLSRDSTKKKRGYFQKQIPVQNSGSGIGVKDQS